jgi:hypothetical protein
MFMGMMDPNALPFLIQEQRQLELHSGDQQGLRPGRRVVEQHSPEQRPLAPLELE